MTDTTLRAVLLGEDRSMSAVLKRAGGAAQSGAHHVKSAWTGMGQMIGGEFGMMIAEVNDKLEAVDGQQAKIAGRLKTLGTVATSVGLMLQSYASQDADAQNQLDAAVEATGKSYDGFKDDVEAAVQAQIKFGHNDVDTKEALRTLTQALGDPKKALGELGLADDLAAAKHESLTEAALQLAKVHAGNTRILKQFGITVGDTAKIESELIRAQADHKNALENLAHAQRNLMDIEAVDRGRKKLTIGQQIQLRNAHEAVAKAQARVNDTAQKLHAAQAAVTLATKQGTDALSQLSHKLHGQASSSMDSFGGKVRQAQTWLEDTASTVSGKFGAAITAAGPVLFGLGAIIESTTVRTIAMATWSKIVAGAQKAWAAAQWLLNAAMDANPIGIAIVAIAALAAGIIYAYHHSETFRNVVNTAFHAISEAARWMWNNGIAPVIRFILNGFATVTRHIADFLNALSHIPGFGWAKTAADKMYGAAAAAENLARKIRDIPNRQVNVNTTYSFQTFGTGALTRALNMQAQIASARGYASGGDNIPGGWAWVGEQGRELMYVPQGSRIMNHGRSEAMAGGGSGGGSDRPIVVQFTLDGRVVHQSLLRLKRTNGGTALGLG